MATVNVNSWAQFVEAVQVSGDTVVCPQGAVWDFNDIYPEGVPEDKKVTVNCAKIKGNGTTLRNVCISNFLFGFRNACEVENLHIENFVTTAGMLFYVHYSACIFRGCRFSGLLAEYPGYQAGLYNTNGGSSQFIGCAFTLEAATSQAFRILWIPNGDSDMKKYCRIKLYLPNSIGYTGENTQWSQINVDCPAQTVLGVNGACANIYGGDLPAVSSMSGSVTTYISLFNSDEIPNLAGDAGVIGVTSSQLRDAAYLSSLGFPIGV